MKLVFAHAFESTEKVSTDESLAFFKEKVVKLAAGANDLLQNTHQSFPIGVSLIFLLSVFLFTSQIMQHAVEAPAEGRTGVFSLPEARLIVHFVSRTFYRNFSA
jgi:hypothetical protein